LARPKVILDTLGIQRLLNDSGVKSMLMSEGNKIAASAGPDFVAEEWRERKVAVVNVLDPTPGALGREARDGNLARAVGRS
jgi:hypothetical protein